MKGYTLIEVIVGVGVVAAFWVRAVLHTQLSISSASFGKGVGG